MHNFNFNFRVSDKATLTETVLFSQNLTWTNTSREIVKGLNPGKPYDLSIIAIGCKENDTQETDPIQVKTDSFEPANFHLENDEQFKLGELFLLFVTISGLISCK